MDENRIVREVVADAAVEPIVAGRSSAYDIFDVPDFSDVSPIPRAPYHKESEVSSPQDQSTLTSSSRSPLESSLESSTEQQESNTSTISTAATTSERSSKATGVETTSTPILRAPLAQEQKAPARLASKVEVETSTGRTVLVINASQSMAHELTLELSSTLPGSTILFAPTLSLALWIIKRRQIDLILSSSILPDGALSTLHESIQNMAQPPELVVISDLHSTRAELGSHPGYRFVELRRVSTRQGHGEETQPIAKTISQLGADLRNDLNNPLQEIVAMAFVAHASQGLSPMAEEALSAIQRAAGNMADVVNMLEDKIRGAVSRSSAV
jgi:signal transduction histidine kinase